MWREREGVNRKSVQNQHGLHADYAQTGIQSTLVCCFLYLLKLKDYCLKNPRCFRVRLLREVEGQHEWVSAGIFNFNTTI